MIYKIWLSRLKGVGLTKKRKWLKEFGSFEDVFQRAHELEPGIDRNTDDAKRIEEACYRKGIYIKTCKEYGITDRNDLPLILYCRGTWLEGRESIGIVGTRRCTEYGKSVTAEVAGKLASEGVTVISGMALGTDGCAHSAAIKAGGYTVAVFGNGPDICFPAEHRSLMEAILQTGLIISEYPPGFHGDRSTYPQRNRIIAAFSDRVLIVESRLKGGALITAEKAREYGKPVFAVPGRLDSHESEGTNRLIAEKKAELWLPEYCKSEPVQLEIPLETGNSGKDSLLLKEIRKRKNGLTADELAEVLGMSLQSVYAELTELETDDIIKTEGDRIWLR